MGNPRYEQQNPRDERLARLAALAQIGAQQDAQDAHSQAAMMEQMKTMYGLQQDAQMVPEKLQELQNKNLYDPQVAQATIAEHNAQASEAGERGGYFNAMAGSLPDKSALLNDRGDELKQKARLQRMQELMYIEQGSPKPLSPQQRAQYLEGAPYAAITATTAPKDIYGPQDSNVSVRPPQHAAIPAEENVTPEMAGNDPYLLHQAANIGGFLPQLGGYIHNAVADTYDLGARGLGSTSRMIHVNPYETNNLLRMKFGVPPANYLPGYYKQP